MCRGMFSQRFGTQGDENHADPEVGYRRIVPPKKEHFTSEQLQKAVREYYDLLLSEYAICESHFRLLCKGQITVAALSGIFYAIATSCRQSHSCLTSPLSRLLAAVLFSQALGSTVVISLTGMSYKKSVKVQQDLSSHAASTLVGVEDFKNETSRINKQDEMMHNEYYNIFTLAIPRSFCYTFRAAFWHPSQG